MSTPTLPRDGGERRLPLQPERQNGPVRNRPYGPPRLRLLGSAADLLDLLGPAQANYGGFGP